MLSYLTNRQYKKITQCLPEALQAQQPQTVYLPSYADPIQKQTILNQINHSGDLRKTGKLKLKKKAKVAESNFLGDCCPTCFSTDNIIVKYYSRRHVCLNCRKFLRDEHGNQIKLFVNKEGDIMCLGIYKVDDEDILELPPEAKKMKNQHFDKDLNNKKKQKIKILNNLDHKVYYQTDYMKLSWNGKSSFVTFAGQDQMVVLLRDKYQKS